MILSTLYLVYWFATIDTVDRYGAEVFILPSAEIIAPVSFKIAHNGDLGGKDVVEREVDNPQFSPLPHTNDIRAE